MADSPGTNPLVQIVGVVSGVSLLTVAVLALLADDHLMVAAPVTACLMVLGIVLGFLASK